MEHTLPNVLEANAEEEQLHTLTSFDLNDVQIEQLKTLSQYCSHIVAVQSGSEDSDGEP